MNDLVDCSGVGRGKGGKLRGLGRGSVALVTEEDEAKMVGGGFLVIGGGGEDSFGVPMGTGGGVPGVAHWGGKGWRRRENKKKKDH